MSKILIIILSFFTWVSCLSQKYSFIPFSTAEGLTQSQVSSIVQDDKGYLWIGTLGGLAKFNGGDFETFSSEDGLLNNRISSLAIIDHDLWIGHEGGVSLYKNGKFKKWKIAQGEKVSNIRSIVKFNDTIYVASHSGLFKILGDKILKVQDQDNYLNHIRSVLIIDHKAFFATMEGVFYTSDFKKIEKVNDLFNVNTSGLALKNDELIITSYFEGVYSLKLKDFKISKLNVSNEENTIKGVYVDSKQNIWYNTNEGIIKVDIAGSKILIDESKGLSFGIISSIYEDFEGSIWLGTLGKGVLRFPSQNFVHYDKSIGLISDLILSIREDENGSLWYGSFDKGFFKTDKYAFSSSEHGVDNTIWCSLFNVDKAKWFGSDFGLVKVKGQSIEKLYFKENGLASDAVTALFKISPTKMIVGGTNGFSYYSNGNFSYENKSKSIGILRDFEFKNNKLYCATSKGLFIKNGGKILKVKGLDKPVSCIEFDKDENLWIGTEEGLFIFKNDRFKRVSFSHLPSSNLITFLNSKNGNILVGTNNGLYIIDSYNESKVLSYSYFGIGEGLVDIETNLNSSFFDSKGFFWFGTSSGLVRFDYTNSIKTTVPPVLNLKAILLNYSKDEILKFAKYKNGKLFKIILPHNKNNLAFEIDGVSLSNHQNLSYQFKLIGADEEWSPLSKNSLISFTGLGADSYELHIRAVDESGMFSNEIIIPFLVNPPFYKTIWFIVASLLLSFGLVYLIFRLKVKRELEHSNNKMLAYKSKLMSLEQKSLNASMNRHFIFNSLNSIQYFINSQDRLSANRYLTNFAKLIRKNLDATNESGNMVTLSQELEGLDLYLSLEAMRFKDRFKYHINSNNIDTESIIIPAMLLQPFIENAIIHGVLPNENITGLIQINLSTEKNILTIQIDDNGIGIKNSMKLKENYDGDHKSQGMEITAKRIDLIKKISNKGFEIIGPFQVGGIDSDVQGTRVLLKIPFENLED